MNKLNAKAPDTDNIVKRFVAVSLCRLTRGKVNIPFLFDCTRITDALTSECSRFTVNFGYYLKDKQRVTSITRRQDKFKETFHPHFIGEWDRNALFDYSCAIENSGSDEPEDDFMAGYDPLQRRIIWNCGDFASKLVFKSDSYLVINSLDSQCDILLVVDRENGVFVWEGTNTLKVKRRC